MSCKELLWVLDSMPTNRNPRRFFRNRRAMRRKLVLWVWALVLVLGLGYAGALDMEAERVTIERGME